MAIHRSPSSTHLGGSSALTGTGVQTYIDFSSEVCSVGRFSTGGNPGQWSCPPAANAVAMRVGSLSRLPVPAPQQQGTCSKAV